MFRMHWMTLVFVSDRSGRAHELRMPRFLFGALVVVIGLCVLAPVAFLVLPTGIVDVTFGHSWKAQMKTVEDKSTELARQLEELKETGRTIRRLAGVEEMESGYLARVDDETGFRSVWSVLTARRDGLPFLADDGLPEEAAVNLAGLAGPATVDGAAAAESESAALFRYVPSIWPVAGWVTREFQSGEESIVARHFGLDVAARESTPVVSTADGIVTFADWDQNLGWLIKIDHGYDMSTRYGHNARLRVDLGQAVRRGQIIALVGNTGRSTAPHLHYEVWKDDVPVDPRGYLPEVIHWDDLLVSLRTER
ncbi:MAG: M23 family metallopeptidase [Gemmatimonadetes bacterium]|nr:M23 family metallopeptidase [Gemmatimonadota bacterium]MYB61947.1 M23 family metallopeptidase [Gemmatimonadota bacterium]